MKPHPKTNPRLSTPTVSKHDSSLFLINTSKPVAQRLLYEGVKSAPPPSPPLFYLLCACYIGASTTQTTGAEACGTCTLKEIYGVMVRVGSDLFPPGQEDLEVLAAQCGVTDGCVWCRTSLTCVSGGKKMYEIVRVT